MRKIEIDKDFLYDLYGSLQAMIRYADDGMLDRRDPDFKIFFDDVDKAYANLKQLDSILDEDYKKIVKGESDDICLN